MTPRQYVTEQVSIMLGRPVNLSDEQVSRYWSAFCRQEERQAGTDAHGNFSHTSLSPSAGEQLERPILHNDLRLLGAGTTSIWPDGRRFAACLSHDVDRIVQRPWRERYRQIAALCGRTNPLKALRWGVTASIYRLQALVGNTNLAPYDFWLEAEGRHGFHSTFFILPETLDQPTPHDHFYRYDDTVELRKERMTFADATRRVRRSGWEIGLHGSYQSAYNEPMLRGEKERLEVMLGKPVTSIRQHYLRFQVDATPGIQAQAGFTADSTLGYSRTIGCRAGIAFPFFWPHAGDLLEVPLIIQDIGLLRNSDDQTLDHAIARARALIEGIAEVGGVVSLSWHTHPDSPGALPCYRALLGIIDELGGWGCSLGELNDWWRARRAAVREGQLSMSA